MIFISEWKQYKKTTTYFSIACQKSFWNTRCLSKVDQRLKHLHRGFVKPLQLSLQIKRGSALCAKDHRRKKSGDQKDQPQQSGETWLTARDFPPDSLSSVDENTPVNTNIIFSQQKERLRQKEANLSSPS